MGYIYVLTNPAMPGLIKIGKTSKLDVRERVDELYQTGVPLPFEITYSCEVTNIEEVEHHIHRAFAPDRVNPMREFFQMNPERVIGILKSIEIENKTSEVRQQSSRIDQQSIDSADNFVALPAESEPYNKTTALEKAITQIKHLFDGEEKSFSLTRQEIQYTVATSDDDAPGKNKIDEALLQLCDGDIPYLVAGKRGRDKTYGRTFN